MSSLAVIDPQEHLTKKLDLEVISQYDPDPGLLRLARVAVQQDPAIQGLFNHDQRTVDREALEEALAQHFPMDETDHVAGYLADEFEQIGGGILLISSETGKALAQLTDEDFYQPSPVPREDGSMVTPQGPRLKPEVEGAIFHWVAESHRERALLDKMLGRIAQTELVSEDGDPRLLALTKGGRRGIAQQVYAALPTLLHNASGIAREFLSHFAFGRPPTGDPSWNSIRVEVGGVSRRPVQDQTTANLRHSVLTSTLAATATSWSRDLATALLRGAVKHVGIGPRQVSQGHTLDEFAEFYPTRDFLLAEPGLATALRRKGYNVLPAPGPLNVLVAVSGPIGFLEVPEDKIGTGTREIHDVWTLETVAEVTLWVVWERCAIFPIQGDFTSGLSYEVL